MIGPPAALLVVGLVLLVACAAPLASAGGGSDNDAEVSLPATLVTEGATPATEAEATVTLSKSREERQCGLGGVLARALCVAVGKGLGPFSVQADASYSWQPTRPRTIEAEEEDEPRVRPDRQQQVTANLTATYSPVAALALIVELNSVTAVTGDDALNERVQLYVTPGVSAEPAQGWNLRAGIQLPVTSARAFDYNLIVILTRGF